MRHRVGGHKLGRTTSHRKAMLRNLAISLLRYEKITTTLPKAKSLRQFVEKIITTAKEDTLHARRQLLKLIPDKEIVHKLFDTINARYADRNGGYVRIIKGGYRLGDAAQLAVVELITTEEKETKAPKKKSLAQKLGLKKEKTPVKADVKSAKKKKVEEKKAEKEESIEQPLEPESEKPSPESSSEKTSEIQGSGSSEIEASDQVKGVDRSPDSEKELGGKEEQK